MLYKVALAPTMLLFKSSGTIRALSWTAKPGQASALKWTYYKIEDMCRLEKTFCFLLSYPSLKRLQPILSSLWYTRSAVLLPQAPDAVLSTFYDLPGHRLRERFFVRLLPTFEKEISQKFVTLN